MGDLAELDVAVHDVDPAFDVIVCAGNVLALLAVSTRQQVLARLREHLTDDGRLIVGFVAERDYEFDDFRAHAEAAGLITELELATWDLRPFTKDADFLVAVLSRAS